MSDYKTGQATGGHISGQSNEPFSHPAHALSFNEVARQLQTNTTTGLSADEAAQRLIKYGPNNLGKDKGVQPLQILIAQVANAMSAVLFLALAASFAIKAWIEGGVLAGIILVNLVIGYYQDLQAARTIASLQSLNSPTARVIRDGVSSIVAADTLVPGDIIELKTGDMVAADARLLHTVNFEADEAALTGESLPSRKDPNSVFGSKTDSDGENIDEVGPGDRLNVVFSSTTITKGRGKAIVFATGMSTEMGAIAAALRADGSELRTLERDENGKASVKARLKFGLAKTWDIFGEFLGVTVGTPLQRKLSKLFLSIFGLAIICAIVVLAANNFSPRSDVIIYAIATAIGTLPVTLVLVLTITMAAGTKVMVQRHVLVRNMRSLEALGGVTNICSDKTGTLTQGKMIARMAWLPGHGTYTINVTNSPYNPTEGNVEFTQAEPKDITAHTTNRKVSALEDTESQSALKDYLDVANLANLALVSRDSGFEWNAQGDPTEIALQVLAARFGRNSGTNPSFNPNLWTQLGEFPFDSSVKKMSIISRSIETGAVHIFTKGAVERVIDSCTQISSNTSMTEESKADILSNMEALARRGLRVLALASRPDLTVAGDDIFKDGTIKRDEFERDLVFRGLVGIYDPPRPESRPSVFKCHQAGIGVHMLTGDHPETARTIAAEVGILPRRMELLRRDVADGIVMTAADFDKLTDEQVDRLPQLPLVVARCAPSTKVRMIDALHRRGCYVAMTGDGVNDSPSLHRADVGIAMGLNGSDVAKSASDIVLSDDNFASILNAVEEGRRIFDNVQKFMLHVLAANVAFVTTLLIGLAYKDMDGVSIFQITPVEILFMLLVAGAFTETGLGFEAASPDILTRPPQSLKYGVFTPEFLADLAAYGIIMAISIITAFVAVLFGMHDGNLGRDCNLEWSESCNGVFRARSTCYTAMMWIFLFFGWELVDSRRSFFNGMVSQPRIWGRRLLNNPFLFWSVVIGSICVFPTLYIPGLDRVVFLHMGIDKEWGVVFAVTALFFTGAEAWKWGKRVYLRRNKMMLKKDEGLDEEDLEARIFGEFYEGGVMHEKTAAMEVLVN